MRMCSISAQTDLDANPLERPNGKLKLFKINSIQIHNLHSLKIETNPEVYWQWIVMDISCSFVNLKTAAIIIFNS